MLKKGFILILSLFSLLEAGTLRLYDEAAETQSAILHLKEGMTKEDVLYIMGYPYQAQNEQAKGRCYEVWLYFYKKPSLSQKRILRRNLIPLIFYKNHLYGWGESDYNKLFESEKEQKRRARLKDVKYSDEKHEWPATEHGYVPSPKEELQKKSSETNPAEARKKQIDAEVEKQKQISPTSIKQPNARSQPTSPTYQEAPVRATGATGPDVDSTSQQSVSDIYEDLPPKGPTAPTEPVQPKSDNMFEQTGSDVYEVNPPEVEEGPPGTTGADSAVESIYIHTDYPREYQQGEKKYKERLEQHEPLD